MLVKSKKSVIAAQVILGLWMVFIIFIVGFTIMNSFKTSAEIYSDVWSLPTKFSFKNYQKALFTSQMYRYFFNSLVISAGTLVALTIISSMSAYILARFTFKLKKLLMALIIFGLGIPEQLLLIPLYKILASINFVNTYRGLITVYTSLCIPFTVFVLIGFFSSIPSEIKESAIIDGCSATWALTLADVKDSKIAL